MQAGPCSARDGVENRSKAAWHLMTLGWPEYPALEVLKAVGSRVGVEGSQELAG